MCPRALLPDGAREAPGDHPVPEGRPRPALRALHPHRSSASTAPDALDEARAAAARSVGVPARRPDVAAARARAAARACRRSPASTTTTSATTTSSASCSSSASPTGCSGRLIARLKRQGIYDDTLIVVTADHGFAWKVGADTRRSVSLSNVDELGSGADDREAARAARGSRDGALAQTLDVTPTIADVLNVPLGYRADGRSIFSRAVRARRTVRIVKRDFSSVVSLSKKRWVARRAAVVRRRLRELGSGDWPSLFTAYGPHRELIGQRVADVRAAERRARDALAGALVLPRPAHERASCPARSPGASTGRAREVSVTSPSP